MEQTFEVRRGNLRRYILENFAGRRAAFARAASVDANQINLLLTANLANRRNLGEALARDMEAALQLPKGHFDSCHVGGEIVTFRSHDITPELSHIVRRSTMLESISVHESKLRSLHGRITSTRNVMLCCLEAGDLEPKIGVGDHLLVDFGVKAISADGAYILRRRDDLFLRSVARQFNGGYLISSATHEPIHVDTMTDLSALGCVVMSWRMKPGFSR